MDKLRVVFAAIDTSSACVTESQRSGNSGTGLETTEPLPEAYATSELRHTPELRLAKSGLNRYTFSRL